MADFHQFFMIFSLNALIYLAYIYEGWAGSQQGWGGWQQRLKQRSKMTQMVEFIVPIAKLQPSIGAISLFVNLHGCQKVIWKSKPADISQRRHAVNIRTQLFSAAINWDNKMNFSLHANMAGFCSDSSHNYINLSRTT